MESGKESARYITRPIQLWAAWLVGLTTVVGIFLGAATQLPAGWERSALVIAAIAYVPAFMITMVILQTRFRAELQEDSYYSQTVVNRKTDTLVMVSRLDTFESKIELQLREILAQTQSGVRQIASQKAEGAWSNWKIALNTRHAEYKAIKQQLEDEGISVSVAFGTEKSPKKWIVAINENMPKPLAVQLLVAVSKFGLDGFAFWPPVREVGETEDVYIGAYGHENYVQFKSNFAESVHDEFDFSEYTLANQKVEKRPK